MTSTCIDRPTICPKIDVYQAMGNRDTQQDSYIISSLRGGVLVAIADGHGSDNVSTVVEKHISRLFKEELELASITSSSPIHPEISDVAMRHVVQRTFRALIERTRNKNGGSTLTMAFVEWERPRMNIVSSNAVRVTVGQMGDSVFALSSKPGHLCVAPMHNVFDAKYDIAEIKKKYLQKYGRKCRRNRGYIYSHSNGLDALAVTRSLGDKAFTLVRKPFVKTYLSDLEGTTILLASDGIFTDYIDTQNQIKNYMKDIRQGKEIAEVGDGIKYKPDNTTIVGIRF